MEYNKIFENNKSWIAERTKADPDYFKKLSRGQWPDYLIIGCSDSRVTVEELMGVEPGEAFVHRNIANLVPNNDNSSASVVEFAVKHLEVKHIIVCGHYLCGGVNAAMRNEDLGILNPWLRTVRDVYRIHKLELNSIQDETKRYERLIELNVQEQCTNIMKMAVWQRRYLETGMPVVHGWVFDIKTGKLVDLKIDTEIILSSIREIYDLGTNKDLP